jgi:hypothetical protein
MYKLTLSLGMDSARVVRGLGKQWLWHYSALCSPNLHCMDPIPGLCYSSSFYMDS